ncbi:hypothetical protein ABD07_13915 [Nitrosomonas oligotropha]|nr:hypothetical protein [Nitrosomonas oligotropha]
MVLYPLYDGRSWKHLLDVWDRWQTFNGNVLLFISSIVVYKSATYFEREQRKRNFVAARAFLPSALFRFSDYFKDCAKVLNLAWDSTNLGTKAVRLPKDTIIPNLPDQYEDVFEKCIRFAEPNFGKYLAYILSQLQIHHARLTQLLTSSDMNNHMPVSRLEIEHYIYRLAELRALLNKLFPYLRGTVEEFGGKELGLDLDDFVNAYGNIDIYPEDFEDLLEFTERQIPRDAAKYENGFISNVNI